MWMSGESPFPRLTASFNIISLFNEFYISVMLSIFYICDEISIGVSCKLRILF